MSVPLPRTGPFGRLARLLIALVLAWWPLYSIADQGGPTSFRDPSNLTEPMLWLLHGAMLLVFVLLVGQLAGATVGPAAVRRSQLAALLAIAVLLAAAALAAWIRSSEVWASPLPELVWGFDALMLVETIVALALASGLGTPGCEVGVWPELLGRLRGGAVSTRPICVLGLHFVDDWEARRARARSDGKRAARAHREE
jgi:signal transduction histidine kinase